MHYCEGGIGSEPTLESRPMWYVVANYGISLQGWFQPFNNFKWAPKTWTGLQYVLYFSFASVQRFKWKSRNRKQVFSSPFFNLKKAFCYTKLNESARFFPFFLLSILQSQHLIRENVVCDGLEKEEVHTRWTRWPTATLLNFDSCAYILITTWLVFHIQMWVIFSLCEKYIWTVHGLYSRCR